MKQEQRPSLSSLTMASSHGRSASSSEEARETGAQAFKMTVSVRFVTTCLLGSMIAAFSMGRAARIYLIEGPRLSFLKELEERKAMWNHVPHAPTLIAMNGHTVPRSRYTCKNFDTARSVTMSSWLVTNRETQHLGGDSDSLGVDEQNDSAICQESVSYIRQEDAWEEENPSQPSSEHLMVDIRNVDGAFLNSESRLAGAIVDLVYEANLPLLSYHCHGFHPVGVSCVGVLLRNYLAFHTWPEDGVITFDLVTTESKSVLPLLSKIELFFGVPRKPAFAGELVAKPETHWAHKLRGFHHDPTEIANLFQVTDLGDTISVLGTDVKEKVASVETKFQRIDVYDVIDPHQGSVESYKKSLRKDGSYEAQNKFLFRPDRILFLDGWLQSSLHFEAAYHEALVQPALFAHENPKRVAIIGGGEGATLREVLKHNTIEEAIMIEIDEELVNVSRDSIPEWSDCSDLQGSSSWCIKDPRATVYYEDALQWFMDRYGVDGEPSNGHLDVIILDALDPEIEIPFAKALYGNDRFMRTFYKSLSDNGILVMQLGESPELNSPDETFSRFKNRANTISLLENLGFQSIHVYEETHCGFLAPWTYIIGFKSYNTRKRWYADAAEVDLEIQKRGVPTKSGASPFQYFDGPTMISYQVPHRVVETVFCRRQPPPEECLEYIFDPSLPNTPADALEVKMSSISDTAGRGLFTKVDIPEESYLSAETAAHPVSFMPSTVNLVESLAKDNADYKVNILPWYMEGYGFTSQSFGDSEVFVDSGILTFVNHGCNHTYNIGQDTSLDEFTVDMNKIPDEMRGLAHKGYNPVIDRHLTFALDQTMPLRNISAGEEILDNYLDFSSDCSTWSKDVQDLRKQCSGQAGGVVTAYEKSHEED